MSDENKPYPTPENCPTPEYHVTHHYCPNCSFQSVDAPTDVVVPAPVFVCDCHGAVTSIRADLDKLLNVVEAIHADLAPTLEAMQSSPLLKMFFPKGNK